MKLNIRLRMVLLTILAIFPTIILLLYLNASEKNIREQEQIDRLKNTATLYSQEHAQIVENARHLLIALSIAPQVNSGNQALCSEYLDSVMKSYQRYSNIGVANKDGDVLCAAAPSQQIVNVANTLFFRETTKNKSFAVGEYRISPATNNAVLSFGYPLSISRGIIYSSIDLSWLNRLTQNLSRDEGVSLLVLDRNGIVLAQHPATDLLIGKKFSQGKLLESMENSPEGVTDDNSFNGTATVYAYKKIGDLPDSPFVVVGTPKDEIFNEPNANFTRRLVLSMVIIALSLMLAWIAGGTLIVKQVQALREVDQLKNDFISLASHQIRTPMTSIKWFSEILISSKKHKLSKKQRELILDIKTSADKVTSLVGTLLNISRFESSKITLSKSTVNLESLVHEVISELQVELAQKKLKILFLEPKKPLEVVVDARLIKQVYSIVISNAIKYSEKKTSIVVSLKKEASEIVSTVKDGGIGIPSSEKSKIFQKFSRAENAVGIYPDGSGLGLYLSKLILESHGGKIWFKSNKSKGTAFSFSLPINKM